MRFGVYIQVPFCQTKCAYCNFHTGVVSSARYEPYAEAVCREVREYTTVYGTAGLALSEGFHQGVVDTVYLGGGTPSLLDPEHLRRMLDEIRSAFTTDLVEVTLEADPETIEEEKARAWTRDGINRVSLGVQSFSDAELKELGVWFPDHRFGELVFLLHPSWLVGRSDFNGAGWMPVGARRGARASYFVQRAASPPCDGVFSR